jgi:DNA-binding MarR family transcriptional regulator
LKSQTTSTVSTTQAGEELASRLRLAITRSARRLRQEAGAGLGPSQNAALATIERHGPLTPSELAQREQIKRPTAARIVARLEAAGLLDRVRDPADGRSAILSINSEGRGVLRRLRARKTAYLQRRLSDLDEGDLATLEAAAAVLERMLEGDGR